MAKLNEEDKQSAGFWVTKEAPIHSDNPIPTAKSPAPDILRCAYMELIVTDLAAAVTGVAWAAAVNWAGNGIWGGAWNGNDVDIDCNKCFNNINGKVNWVLMEGIGKVTCRNDVPEDVVRAAMAARIGK